LLAKFDFVFSVHQLCAEPRPPVSNLHATCRLTHSKRLS
jgi:hypothetical protein